MKKIFLLFSLVFAFSMSAQKAYYTDDDGNGVIEYVLLDNEGNKLETGFYCNKKMTGTWISYHPGGKKNVVAKFKNGVRHGNWIIYNQQGQIVYQILYKSGKKVSASQHNYATNN